MLVITFLALCAAGYSVFRVEARSAAVGQLAQENSHRISEVGALTRENARLTRQINREGRERRDQSCRQDERAHLADVVQLRRTYQFLLQYPDSELAPAVMQSLPALEQDARVDKAPAWCDKPGIGLKEPDPRIPKRPPELRK